MPKAVIRANPAERRPFYWCAGLPWDRIDTTVEIKESPAPYKPAVSPKVEDGEVKEPWARPTEISWDQLGELIIDSRVQVQIYPDATYDVPRTKHRGELAKLQMGMIDNIRRYVESAEQQAITKRVSLSCLPSETRPYFQRDMAKQIAREAELLSLVAEPTLKPVLQGRFDDEQKSEHAQGKRAS